MRKIVLLVIFILITLNIFSELAEKSYVDAPPAETIQLPDSIITQDRANPFLYNNWVGCLMDGAIFLVPMLGTVMLNSAFNGYNGFNILVPCLTVPFGAVLTEKFIKSVVINGIDRKQDNHFSSIAITINPGFVTPPTFKDLSGQEIPISNIEIRGFSKLSILYRYSINNNTSFISTFERYTALIFEHPVYYSIGVGFNLHNYTVTVDNVIFGREQVNYSGGYDIVWRSWIGKFPGVGLGWTKRFYMYRGLFIEPGLQLKIAGAINGEDASLLGIFGGINIGYRF